jgi:hypothetical protein
MTRQDMHLDAMLRHLGAAYYDSITGRAARAEVRRAVARVASQLGGESVAHGPGAPDSWRQLHGQHGKLHCRVRDVMATNVVTIELATPFKEIARILVERRISGAPVLMPSGRLAGRSQKATCCARRTGTWTRGVDGPECSDTAPTETAT